MSATEKIGELGLARMEAQGLGDEYRKRFDYELGIIDSGGWSDYFMVTWDVCREADERGIWRSDGRGSAVSSLVCYLLRITRVDPLKYGLLFERFMNPHRVSPPDIDLDFEDERRHEIFEYVIKKYGSKHVALISTFSEMGIRGAIRDAARALDVSRVDLDRILNCFPRDTFSAAKMAKKTRFQDADDKATVQRIASAYPLLSNLVNLLVQRPRHTSTHAAGVVISSKPLIGIVPMKISKSGLYMTQWSLDDLEACGCVKYDFLGLDALTIMKKTVELAEARSDEPLDLKQKLDENQIDFEIPEIYEALTNGDVGGIFQVDTNLMRRAFAIIQPKSFRELYDVVAINRPGSISFIPDYARRKPKYLHKALIPILESTYGIMMYQEQSIEMVAAIAGFDKGDSDRMRRAIGKKLAGEEIDNLKTMFLEGCKKTGVVPRKIAEQIWVLLETATGYSFNKSHAVAYGGYLAYKMAWLKMHYREEFMTALLNVALSDRRKLVRRLDECRQAKTSLLPLDARRSGAAFTLEADGIRLPMTLIKGIGAAFMAKIDTLGNREYPNVFAFRKVVPCSSAIVEKLIKAGAFDYIGRSRPSLMMDLQASERGTGASHDLFAEEPEPWPPMESVRYEIEATGMIL